MKLSEVKNEDALDMLADLLEPAARIFADKNIADALSGGQKFKAVRCAIKDHKKEVLEILAIMDGVPVEEYSCNVLTLPLRLIELLNEPVIEELFSSQEQKISAKHSTSVTETTPATETK